jgi:hypothetical protein
VENKWLDLSKNLPLDNIHDSLIHQEGNIILNLLERAQYCYNGPTYDVNSFTMSRLRGSLTEFIVRETKILHAKVRLLKFKQLSKTSEFPIFFWLYYYGMLIYLTNEIHRLIFSKLASKFVWRGYVFIIRIIRWKH